jgi:pimeloyl-ACP methyl ester carboxylesterase
MKSIQLSDGRKMSFLHHVCEKVDAPTIVFAHGFPLDHSMWQGQLPLAEAATLVMPDLPGFGDSDAVTDELTMKSMADDVADLLKQIGVSKVIFCGLSMGGYIGWEFVHNHGDMLDGLICCNTRATADDETTARARRLAVAQVMQNGTEPIAVAMKQKLFSSKTLSHNVELVDDVSNVILDANPQTVAAAQLGMAKRTDHSELLQQIDARTLVIAGADDQITPADEMRDMSFLIGESSFVEIADAGHLSPAEQPRIFNHAVIHWLG